MGSLDGFCISFDLHKVVKENNITTLVETGCHLGHSLSYAIPMGFKTMYSCDIDQKYIDICTNRFRNQDNIILEHCSSVDFLTNLLPKLDDQETILFFLDAHLPEHDAAVNVALPLEEELDIIWQHRKDKKDHIIVDDWRIYEENDFTGGNWNDRSQYGNPTLEFLNKYDYKIQKFLTHEGYLYLSK